MPDREDAPKLAQGQFERGLTETLPAPNEEAAG